MRDHRQLGYWESALCLLHDKLAGTGTIFNAVILAGQLNFDTLELALRQLFNRHPLLRATIAKKPEGYYFTTGACFSNVVIDQAERKTDRTWETLVEQALNQLFDLEKILWRVIVVQSHGVDQCEVIFLCHHAIADGLSCAYFVDYLLDAYHEISRGNQPNVSSLPLLEPVEKCLDREALAQLHAAENAPSQSAASFGYQDYAPLGARLTKSVYRILSSEHLAQLTAQCHLKEINMNALLNAVMLKTADDMDADQFVFDLLTPVNLRALCNPVISREHFGCYISCVSTEFDQIQSSDLWQLAKRYQVQLKHNVAKLAALPETFEVNNQAQLSRLLAIDDATSRRHFPAGFVVTNKGKLPFKRQYGPLTLRAYFTSSSRQAGDIVINLSINTLLDQAFLTFSYTEPLIQAVWAEGFAEVYMRNLVRLV